MTEADPVRVVPELPLRVACAVIVLKEGAHEITLSLDGKSVRIIAEQAVVIAPLIASTERRQGSPRKTRTC